MKFEEFEVFVIVSVNYCFVHEWIKGTGKL